LRPEYRLLKTVPGIGQTLATTIMLETGSIGRFAQNRGEAFTDVCYRGGTGHRCGATIILV
jgi:hypothetical protein